MNRQLHQRWHWLSLPILGMLLLAGCVAPVPSRQQSVAVREDAAHAVTEALPALTPVALGGRKLRVVATTNLVGDVAAQVGGEQIELATLLAPGVDPHAYQLAPADRQQLEDADVILINGLGLEVGMLPVLAELAGRVPVVPVSAGIETINFGENGAAHHENEAHEEEAHEEEAHEEEAHEEEAHEEEGEHHHAGVDPHSWQSVPNVMVWTQNIATALSALDPANADHYAAAAATYEAELAALDAELHTLVDVLPRDERRLVTDHDSLGYFAHHYGFTIVGTLLPSLSTLAAASAQELAALQTQIRAEGVNAIFVGTTVDTSLVAQLAVDLGIQVVPIYTDSLSAADGPAATYVALMRHNVQTIMDALRE